MILKIDPVHQDGVNCLEDVAYMVANWLNRDYELTFCSSWVFDFFPENGQSVGLLGDRIFTQINNLNLLGKFCGIFYIQKNETDSEKTFAAIKQELAQRRPVAIYMDSYWCPWLPDYQKLSHSHFCLVIGIDSSENLLCLEQISNEVCTLSKTDFTKGSGFYFTFNILEQPQIKNYHEILIDSVNMTINRGTFNNIRSFINHFEVDFNFDLEFQAMETSIWDVPIHRNIGLIAGSRTCYARFLALISKKLGFSQPLPQIQEFKTLSSKWNTSRAILAKSYYKIYDQRIKSKVINLFNEIAEKEENLASSLLEIRPEKTLINIPNSVENSPQNLLDFVKQKYTYIDLTQFFNNNAFGSSVSPNCSADFTGTGYYFLTKYIPSGILSTPGGMSFLFPEVMDGRNDNIFCENQVIGVSGKYNSIMILGCAEYGMYNENLTIEYEDGEHDSIIIKFTDWAYEPIYGETIAWMGRIVEKKNNETRLLPPPGNRIFAKEYQFPEYRVIKNIILPNCLCIHIFAITLCNYD